jgi:hypothetical protein
MHFGINPYTLKIFLFDYLLIISIYSKRSFFISKLNPTFIYVLQNTKIIKVRNKRKHQTKLEKERMMSVYHLHLNEYSFKKEAKKT